MLAVAALFLVWAFARPLSEELDEDEEPARTTGRRARAGRSGARRSEATSRRAGRDRAGPAGRGAPGGSSASTEPPKPPPTMRAPAAPARLSCATVVLDLGHARLVVVAQAGVRGVEQPAGLGRSPASSAATIASTRAFSESTWRARRRSGSGSRAAASGSAAREVLDAERLAGGAALRAALVVAARGVAVLGAGVERHEPPVAELERHGLELERARSRSAAPRPARLQQRRELVEQPGLGADPVVLDARAEPRQLGAVGLLGAGEREQREAERGLERRGGGEAGALRDVAGERQPRARHVDAGGAQLRDRAAHERAPALGAVRRGGRGTRRSRRGRAPRPGSRRRRAARPRPSRRGRSRTAARARRCSRCARRSGSRGRGRRRGSRVAGLPATAAVVRPAAPRALVAWVRWQPSHGGRRPRASRARPASAGSSPASPRAGSARAPRTSCARPSAPTRPPASAPPRSRASSSSSSARCAARR